MIKNFKLFESKSEKPKVGDYCLLTNFEPTIYDVKSLIEDRLYFQEFIQNNICQVRHTYWTSPFTSSNYYDMSCDFIINDYRMMVIISDNDLQNRYNIDTKVFSYKFSTVSSD